MAVDRLSPFDVAALQQLLEEWSGKATELRAEWRPRWRRMKGRWGITPEGDPFIDPDGFVRWKSINSRELIRRIQETPDFLLVEDERKSWVVAACRFFSFLLEFLDSRVPAKLSETQIRTFLSPLAIMDPERGFLDDLPHFIRLLRDEHLTPAKAAALRMYELELRRAGAPRHATTYHLKEALHLEDRRRKVHERLVRANTSPRLPGWPQVPISSRRSTDRAR